MAQKWAVWDISHCKRISTKDTSSTIGFQSTSGEPKTAESTLFVAPCSLQGEEYPRQVDSTFQEFVYPDEKTFLPLDYIPVCSYHYFNDSSVLQA